MINILTATIIYININVIYLLCRYLSENSTHTPVCTLAQSLVSVLAPPVHTDCKEMPYLCVYSTRGWARQYLFHPRLHSRVQIKLIY